MAKKQSSASESAAQSHRYEELMRKRERLLEQLREVETELEQFGTVQQRREEAIKPLRDAIEWVGDVESPSNEQWDAER